MLMLISISGGVRTSGPFLAAESASGEGTARTLRTTQWTRASFELIFDQLILMILKIISQFRVGLRSKPILDKTHVISSL
jgi:hypothetical protein